MAPPPPSNSPPSPPPDGEKQPSVGDFVFLGTSAALAVIAGGGIGYLIDSNFGTLPWATFVGLAFGIASAVLLVARRVREFL